MFFCSAARTLEHENLVMKQMASVRSQVAIATLTALLSSSSLAHAADEVNTRAKVVTLDSSSLSPDLLEVAKLAQAGVDEAVVLAFIQKNTLQRSPTADELIYLRSVGLSSEAMVGLMNSVKKLAAMAQVAREPRQPATAQAPAPATVVSPQVIYTQPAPVYVPSPVVYEPAWSYPVFSFGLDFGHHILGHVFGHHGGGHHRGHHGRH